MKFNLLIFFITFSSLQVFSQTNFEKTQNIERLDFFVLGSSNHQRFPSSHWRNMYVLRPDLLLLMGDTIYSDLFSFVTMKQDYARVKNNLDFKKLTQKTPYIGVWDDRDYGGAGEGYNYLFKDESQKHFYDFMDEPLDSEKRKSAGIYTTYEFGKGEQKVKMFLLDLRYFRDSDYLGKKDLLGEKQWLWFEKELMSSDAKINFIVSSSSVFLKSNKSKKYDRWIDYPDSFKRLMFMVDKYKPSGVFFLSGDRRFSLIHDYNYKFHKYHEFISSSFTHRSFKTSSQLRKIHGSACYAGRNFGSVKISWFPHPVMTLRVHSSGDGNVQVKRNYILENGQFKPVSDDPFKK